MSKVFHVCFIALFISSLFINSGAVFADEITDSIGEASDKNGEINIVVEKQYLVSVKGRDINQNDLVDYASAIDYKTLKKF
jgi:hypothetical protein